MRGKRKHGSNSDIVNLYILSEKQCCEDRSDYPINSWNNIKDTTLHWKGLDRFGDVYDRVSWDKGPSGIYFHESCRLYLQNK